MHNHGICWLIAGGALNVSIQSIGAFMQIGSVVPSLRYRHAIGAVLITVYYCSLVNVSQLVEWNFH